MKRILVLLTIFTTSIFSNINIIVSILPEKTFVQAIGGEKVDLSVMVLPGNSPHTYEPKPSQMRSVATATLYFAIGVEFEKIWLPKFRDLNPAMHIIDLSKKIEKLPIVAAKHNKEDQHHGPTADPHIWTAPHNVSLMAAEICKSLSEADPANSLYYHKRLDDFLLHIKKTDETIKTLLANGSQRRKFMVFHPSWGYFAKAYGLTQIPVEVEGKSPKPRELIALVKKAEAEKISAIFTQPEFSDSSARLIASELQIPVIKVSPLAPDWSENLIRITKAIAGVK